MGLHRNRILICGGGIAGLTAALCLADKGFSVEVLEKTPSIDPVGAGIQLSPNALAIYAELGLIKNLKNASVAPQAINLLKASNAQQLLSIPLGAETITRFGLPYLVIHRADLQNLLLAACEAAPDISVRLGHEVSDVAPHDNGITITTRFNSQYGEFSGRALIGADGVWSRLRSDVIGAPKAEYSGFTAWRALLPKDGFDASVLADFDNTQLWLSKNAHCVCYPVRGGQYLNLVAITRESHPVAAHGYFAQNESDGTNAASKENPDGDFGKRFSGWAQQFPGNHVPSEEWTRWPLFGHKAKSYRNPLWHRGPICLIGDAAHAMLPFAAQGAAMGIEDAAVIANLMAAHDDNETAFTKFTGERKGRIRRVVRLSEENRDIYHMGWPMATARNITMRLLGGEKLLSRQNWLYGWVPEDANLEPGQN